jgi:hypothetical protein
MVGTLGKLCELGDGLCSVEGIEFLENALQMIFDGECADVENAADFVVGLAFFDPVHDFYFTIA